jgi:hypothetical protein
VRANRDRRDHSTARELSYYWLLVRLGNQKTCLSINLMRDAEIFELRQFRLIHRYIDDMAPGRRDNLYSTCPGRKDVAYAPNDAVVVVEDENVNHGAP